MDIEGHTNGLKRSYAIFGMALIPRENFTAEKFTPENPIQSFYIFFIAVILQN